MTSSEAVKYCFGGSTGKVSDQKKFCAPRSKPRMDKKYSPSNSSNLTINDDNNITSKLRRLRIQEALLLQSVEKQSRNINEDDVELNSSSYKNLVKKVKDSYINLKNLYDEVKANTQSQELFVDLDIDEVKKKIYELETNIKIFKSNIYSELADLKLSEQDLNKQLNENPNEIENTKWRPKIQSSVNYNAIVPSPVRAQMTSPFKCLEVQQFQEFMKSSTNRYGGWNEYNHNLFVKYWQKFFGKSYISEFADESFQRSLTFQMFMEEVFPKLQGVTTNVFDSYVKWYVKYLFLKDMQQIAIDKWKLNKICARKILKKVMYADEVDNFPLETITDAQGYIASSFNTRQSHLPEKKNEQLMDSKTLKNKRKLHSKRPAGTHSILKPTKQWLNRYQLNADGAGTSSGFHSIESMEKQLHTPNWRLGL